MACISSEITSWLNAVAASEQQITQSLTENHDDPEISKESAERTGREDTNKNKQKGQSAKSLSHMQMLVWIRMLDCFAHPQPQDLDLLFQSPSSAATKTFHTGKASMEPTASAYSKKKNPHSLPCPVCLAFGTCCKWSFFHERRKTCSSEHLSEEEASGDGNVTKVDFLTEGIKQRLLIHSKILQ